MDASIIAAIIGAVATVVVGVAGIFLGTYLTQRASVATAKELAKLDYRKLVRDRLWDHQRDAYTSLIGKITAMRAFADRLAEGYEQGQSDHHGFEETAGQFWKEWTEALSQFHAGRLIFGHEFHNRYEALVTAISTGTTEYGDDEPFNYFEWIGERLDAAFVDLVDIARRDIGTEELTTT